MSYSGEHPAQPLRRYLLGQLGEEDMERLDRRILAEAEAVAALDSTEDDLIEDYLDGSLDGAERAAFEEHFLASPSHRQSLDLARMIRERLQGEAAPAVLRPRRVGGAWLGAVAALLLMAVWFLIPPREERPRVADQGGPTSTPLAVASPPETPNASSPSPNKPPGQVASVAFAVNREMAPESKPHTLRLDAGVDQVRLEILIEGHEAYRDLSARLEGPGARVYTWKSVPLKEIVSLTLPAQWVSPGRYTLVLQGREGDGAVRAELDRWELVVDKR